MDFPASVMENVKGGDRGALIDFSGAQTLVNAVRSLDELNSGEHSQIGSEMFR